MSEPTVTRRDLGGVAAGAGLTAAASGAIVEASAQSAPKTFVLVHGAWHGGWCWRRVSDLLEKKGHKVFAPTLTGLGERSHLLTKDVNLDTHIADIVNVVKWEDLRDVCLVVHSYGGWPGSGAIEQIGDRVSSIVWLDAFKPESGQRGADYTSEAFRKALFAAVEKGEPGRPAPRAEAFGVNEKDRAWVESKLTPHTRQGGEEDLHPRRKISAADFRQGAGGMQGRPVMAHLRDHGGGARRDGRCTGMVGWNPAAGVLRNSRLGRSRAGA
jgi:Alpha/beta hydrolase family